MTGLAYSWREICVKNLLKVFTETRLEDQDIPKTQPWDIVDIVDIVHMDRGNQSQE